ncbi:MAG: CPBP family intramembrane metalloprotease [Acidimicrobiia bacterium]|nr:CPBP family intramembrane metalloprotease [Acidimicrobiia bacterium]
MATRLDDQFTASAEEWRCACGRLNAVGLSLCPHCGRVPPRGVATTTFAATAGAMRPTWKPRVRALRLAFGVILLNIANTVFFIVLVETGHMEDSTAIAVQTALGLVFYGVVLGMMSGALLTLRPVWLKGNLRTARLLGAEVGFGAAVLIIAMMWLASGHAAPDISIGALVSEGSVGRVLIAFVLLAVAAPFVEELLFRGVVAESLRRRGPVIAIGVSAFLFGLAHLELSVIGLASKTAGGVVLGILYWRRGLWASIAAHAAYNGSLVVMAVLVVLGPTHLLTSNGVSVTARSDWQVSGESGVANIVPMVLNGPSGATFVVEEFQSVSQFPSLDALAEGLNDNQVPLPEGTTLHPGTAHVTAYPMGRAVQMEVTHDHHAGVVVLVPRAQALWEVDIFTQGSHRAVSEYPDMLRTLVLPGS